MKRRFLLVLLLVMLFPLVTKAESVTVTSFDELKANNVAGNVLNYTGNKLSLTENINLVATLNIKANTTLNLNGNTLTISGHGNNYAVVVYNQLTINGEGTVSIPDLFGFTTSGSGSPKIIVNSGTFNQTGDYYMFALFAGEIVINDGTFVTPYCVVNNFSGLYNLNGKLTINGGTFTTDEDAGAPVMNAGTTIINDGTFTSTGDEGNAIYTDPTGTTTIIKGTFTTTGNDAVTIINKGTTIIENGTFESSNGSAIENDTSENNNASLTLVGGNYSDSSNSVAPFVDEESVEYTDANGNSQVIPREELIYKAFPIAQSASDEDLALINSKISDGFQLGKTFDVTLWLVNPNDGVKVEQLTQAPQNVNIVLDVSDLPSVPQGLVREFEVVKVHNGVASVLKATDNGNGTISTKSKEFSTYAVTYRDTNEIQNRETSEVGSSVGGNPNTHDPIILLLIMFISALTGIVTTLKKLANY